MAHKPGSPRRIARGENSVGLPVGLPGGTPAGFPVEKSIIVGRRFLDDWGGEWRIYSENLAINTLTVVTLSTVVRELPWRLCHLLVALFT